MRPARRSESEDRKISHVRILPMTKLSDRWNVNRELSSARTCALNQLLRAARATPFARVEDGLTTGGRRESLIASSDGHSGRTRLPLTYILSQTKHKTGQTPYLASTKARDPTKCLQSGLSMGRGGGMKLDGSPNDYRGRNVPRRSK